jgi:hypothetical protein
VLKWSISHDDRLVVFEVTEELRAEEIQSALTAIVAEGALPYRKLVDARFAPLTLGGTDIRWMSSITDSAAKNITLGPAAFVSGLDFAADIIEHFNRRMGTDRPLRIFRDIASAMQWLDEIAPTVRPNGC